MSADYIKYSKDKISRRPTVVAAQFHADIRPDGQTTLFGAHFNRTAKAPKKVLAPEVAVVLRTKIQLKRKISSKVTHGISGALWVGMAQSV